MLLLLLLLLMLLELLRLRLMLLLMIVLIICSGVTLCYDRHVITTLVFLTSFRHPRNIVLRLLVLRLLKMEFVLIVGTGRMSSHRFSRPY
uniref:Uncharacterized protein n=1 Tax=Anopheles braziliensis TaxID=58242 RepID=A0A2M3ZM28_9DIPT